MEKHEKKRARKYISWVCIVALVVFLAVMPMLASSHEASDSPEASILSGTAQRGQIDNVLIGGGALTEEDAVEITIPAGVKLTQYLVDNGDTVKEGDPVASVDRVTVMSAITGVQETLEYLAEEMEAAGEEEDTDEVIAQPSGVVKVIYAQEGDSVQDVLLQHGALAVLSLDGLMAVEMETDSALSAGDQVTVTMTDGTAQTGKVESNLEGIMVVTIPDDGFAVGQSVQVTTEKGGGIGSGALYIHRQWNATAYSGTIADIKVSEGDEVDAGDTLMKLEDTGHSAAYQKLSDQHREYEELMLELFVLYQTEQVNASADGVISGVDEESAYLLSEKGTEWTLTFLTNSPNGDDETTYSNFVGQVTDVGIDGLIIKMSKQNLQITDYTDLTGVPTDPSTMTEEVVYCVQAPVYELAGGQWQQINSGTVSAGDILLFAGDANGNIVWIVRVASGTAVPGPTNPEDSTQPTVPTTPSDSPETTIPPEAGDPTQPADPTQPSGSEDPSAPSEPSQSSGTMPSTDSKMPSIRDQLGAMAQYGTGYPQIGSSYSGGFSQGGMPEAEPAFELYSLEPATIAQVTAQEMMTLEIVIDELDIGKISVGQIATVTVDALSGETFTAEITRVDNTGTNEGGNSKFAVELTLERCGDMLPGMNATALISLGTTADVVSIPVAALNDNGSESFLYTSYDEENGTLGDPVTVTVGASDGENAEVISGIEEGTVFYYAYYDTLEISNVPEMAGFRFGR